MSERFGAEKMVELAKAVKNAAVAVQREAYVSPFPEKTFTHKYFLLAMSQHEKGVAYSRRTTPPSPPHSIKIRTAIKYRMCARTQSHILPA